MQTKLVIKKIVKKKYTRKVEFCQHMFISKYNTKTLSIFVLNSL